ncbi:threonine ammonia-lyase [Solicola sp. PLA-1-18]|uniref:threonine ammonia-lyase n=1 Tax=Solicola sp. PLA-1-18 TaxID=3380532 RepID=UPI003B81DA0D
MPDVPSDLADARRLLEGVAETTPVQDSRWLSGAVGSPVVLKCENLQRAGSFKIRGAYVRIARLEESERRRGVVAASAGNHAQGVALSASLLGVPATVYMPDGAPIPKEKATRAYGADVRFAGPSVESAIAAAAEHAERTGAVLIHPFDHADVVAGQATVALEVLEQVPEVSTVVVSMGGGGLAAGVALAVHAVRPDVRVVGVQSERMASYPASLSVGTPVTIDPLRTMADGIAVARPGDVPFAAVRDLVDTVLTVTEDDLSQALLLLLERAKMLVEPAGAAAAAALVAHPEVFAGERGTVVPILSGGNIDPILLMQVIRHGMVSAGRYLSFRVRIPDRPGELVRLLDELARQHVNVLDVVHERTAAALHVDEVEVALQVETRGDAHREAVQAHLRGLGYPLGLA